MDSFKALQTDFITLHLISESNLPEVYSMLGGWPDSETMRLELMENYLPRYEKGQRTGYGFYAMQEGEIAGMSLLVVDDPGLRKGFTGADTFMHMRGRGVAPGSKPHLLYLAFEMLGLHRVETGCLVSNTASKKSIEKTPGFQLEGVMRKSGLNDDGEFEDEYFYAMLESDWARLYDKTAVNVIR